MDIYVNRIDIGKSYFYNNFVTPVCSVMFCGHAYKTLGLSRLWMRSDNAWWVWI